eukprot:g10844.t1
MAPKLKDVQEELAAERRYHATSREKLHAEQEAHAETKRLLNEQKRRSVTQSADVTQSAEKHRDEQKRLESEKAKVEEQVCLREQTELAERLAREKENLELAVTEKTGDVVGLESRLAEALEALARTGSNLIQTQEAFAVFKADLGEEIEAQLGALRRLAVEIGDQGEEINAEDEIEKERQVAQEAAHDYITDLSNSYRGDGDNSYIAGVTHREDHEWDTENDLGARAGVSGTEQLYEDVSAGGISVKRSPASPSGAEVKATLVRKMRDMTAVAERLATELNQKLEKENLNHRRTKEFLAKQLRIVAKYEAAKRKPIELLHKGALTARPRTTYEFNELEFQLQMGKLTARGNEIARAQDVNADSAAACAWKAGGTAPFLAGCLSPVGGGGTLRKNPFRETARQIYAEERKNLLLQRAAEKMHSPKSGGGVRTLTLLEDMGATPRGGGAHVVGTPSTAM